jgi:hypothetical protein
MQLPRVRFTVRRLMVVVAIAGLLLWAWLYGREIASIDRSLTAIDLRAFAEGDAVQRRMAIDYLWHSSADDLTTNGEGWIAPCPREPLPHGNGAGPRSPTGRPL